MRTPRTPIVVPPTNRTSPGWQEFNSLPVTPPPVTDPGALNPPAMPSPIASPTVRAKGGILFVVAGAVALAAVAALFIFFPHGKPQSEAPSTGAATLSAAPPPPSRPVVEARAGTAPAVEIPAEAPQPIKRRVEPENAEAPFAHVRPKAHASKPVERPLGGDWNADRPADTKIEPRVVPVAPPAEDFGMSLQRPVTKRPTRKIDETDPYAP
jgi:hypothetical protein